MSVDEQTKRKLLAEVRRTSEQTRALRVQMQDSAAERARAVQSAMEAGIARAQIAEAAGVTRQILYRIASEGE